MQKLSEAVYASLFWLISGLLVWLVILPIAIICLPVILLRAIGQVLFNMPPSNSVAAERNLHTNSEGKSTNLVESLLSSLLITTVIRVPAMLAAVISLQPTRLLKGNPVHNHIKLQPQPTEAQHKQAIGTVDIPAEEKTSGT